MYVPYLCFQYFGLPSPPWHPSSNPGFTSPHLPPFFAQFYAIFGLHRTQDGKTLLRFCTLLNAPLLLSLPQSVFRFTFEHSQEFLSFDSHRELNLPMRLAKREREE